MVTDVFEDDKTAPTAGVKVASEVMSVGVELSLQFATTVRPEISKVSPSAKVVLVAFEVIDKLVTVFEGTSYL